MRGALIRVLCLVLAGAAVGLAWRPEAFDQIVYGEQGLDSPSVANRRHRPELNRPLGTMSHEEAVRRFQQGDLCIIDTRLRSEYVAGHIPGAFAWFRTPAETFFRELRPFLARETTVLVTGRDRYDTTPKQVAANIRLHGHLADVVLLEDGMKSWLASAAPIVAGWDMGWAKEKR